MIALAEFAIGMNVEQGQTSPQLSRFRLDAANRCLWLRNDWGSGERIPLTPNAFDMLRRLIELAHRRTAGESHHADIAISRFKGVIEYIDENLDRNISLVDLAALMGLSPSRFSHVFKVAYGVAPYRYILERRIERAKVLLCNSDATVAAISEEVGFSSQGRFSRVFTRSTGTTPSVYRTTRKTTSRAA